MGAIVLGMFAVTAVLCGAMSIAERRYGISILLGLADMALVVLSALGFKRLLIMSGKVLTPELFGFGYNKQVLAVYTVLFVIGVAYVLIGLWGIRRRTRKQARHI